MNDRPHLPFSLILEPNDCLYDEEGTSFITITEETEIRHPEEFKRYVLERSIGWKGYVHIVST